MKNHACFGIAIALATILGCGAADELAPWGLSAKGETFDHNISDPSLQVDCPHEVGCWMWLGVNDLTFDPKFDKDVRGDGYVSAEVSTVLGGRYSYNPTQREFDFSSKGLWTPAGASTITVRGVRWVDDEGLYWPVDVKTNARLKVARIERHCTHAMLQVNNEAATLDVDRLTTSAGSYPVGIFTIYEKRSGSEKVVLRLTATTGISIYLGLNYTCKIEKTETGGSATQGTINLLDGASSLSVEQTDSHFWRTILYGLAEAGSATLALECPGLGDLGELEIYASGSVSDEFTCQ